jgi:cytoskeletal protein CcmA (bactofilin family)
MLMLKTAGNSVTVRGNLISHSDFYFDGDFEGTIEARRSVVTLGPNSRFAGRIRAREIIVGGTVLGDMVGHERIEVQSTGQVNGNVSTTRISIQDGAYFKGRVSDAQPVSKEALAEQEILEARYSKLANLRYQRGLTAAEEREMRSLFARLSGNDPALPLRSQDNIPEPVRVG